MVIILSYLFTAVIFMGLSAIIFREYDEKSKSWKCYSYDMGSKEESYAAPIGAGLVWPMVLVGGLIYIFCHLITKFIKKVINSLPGER